MAGGFNTIDIAFSLYASFACIVFSLQWMQQAAVIKSMGNLLDALGGYFVLRFLIQDLDDIQRAIKILAAVALVVGVCMINEQITHTNVFGLLGGMPIGVAIRDGKARATGSFEVYITAGVFGATLLPLCIYLWTVAKSRLMAAVGIAGATIMTATSNSSTPVLSYVAGVVALCFWPFRGYMRAFRWGFAILLVSLHIIMNAPVWALIARIDLTGSSTGYHRYMLVDNFIRHFSDWWLLGAKDYNAWGYDMWDLSNQYVAYGVTGGLVTLSFFIVTIVRSFSRLGLARSIVMNDRQQEWGLWCVGAAVVAHVVAYFGVGYFDQMQVAWYALLAITCVVTLHAIPASDVQGELVAPDQEMVNTDQLWRAIEAE